MPLKKKQGSTPKESCCICRQAISVGKEEALFCVGSCQQWLHRHCASVSAQQYKAITDSNSPFLCPCCCHERHQGQITELTNTVEAMKLEIAQLKKSLAHAAPTQPTQSESAVAALAPAFTFENVMGALQGMDWGKMKYQVRDHTIIHIFTIWERLAGSLGIPYSKQGEIKRKYRSDEYRGRAVIEHWILTDAQPSWRKLIWSLDRGYEFRAADAIRGYAEPPTEPTLTVENVTGVMAKVVKWPWRQLAIWLHIPHPVEEEIKTQYLTEKEKWYTLGEYWVKTAPEASWETLAGVLSTEKEALEAAKQYLPTMRDV